MTSPLFQRKPTRLFPSACHELFDAFREGVDVFPYDFRDEAMAERHAAIFVELSHFAVEPVSEGYHASADLAELCAGALRLTVFHGLPEDVDKLQHGLHAPAERAQELSGFGVSILQRWWWRYDLLKLVGW